MSQAVHRRALPMELKRVDLWRLRAPMGKRRRPVQQRKDAARKKQAMGESDVAVHRDQCGSGTKYVIDV
jgi:hypothetical protein